MEHPVEVVGTCDHLHPDSDLPATRLVALGPVNAIALCRLCAMALVGEVVRELFAGGLEMPEGEEAGEATTPVAPPAPHPRFEQERYERRLARDG